MLKDSAENIAVLKTTKLIRHSDILTDGTFIKGIDNFVFSRVKISLVKASPKHHACGEGECVEKAIKGSGVFTNRITVFE